MISNHSNHGEDETGKGRENATISVSQFIDLAASCILYLASPDLACALVRQGRLTEEARHFLLQITHPDDQQEKSRARRDHEHIDTRGLEALLQALRDHYEPSHNEVSLGLQL